MAFFPEFKAPPSALAITSLALGAASIVLFFAGPLLALPAVVMGVLALVFIARNAPPRQGKAMAYGGIALGMVGLMVPVLIYAAAPFVFSLDRFHDTLNRGRDAKNAQYLLAVLKYRASKNKGTLPEHLSEIVADIPSTSILVGANSKTTPLPRKDAADWREIAPRLEEHCDYRYIGADVTLAGLLDANQIIILYSKDIYPDQSRLVGFADGHVEWIRASSMQAAFDNSNEKRDTNLLPALALDGPPPLPKSQLASATKNSNGEVPLPPPPPPEVKTLPDAITSLKSIAVDRRQAAITFLIATPPDNEHRSEISVLLEGCVAEPALRLDALTALKTWATPQNVPGLVKRLTAIKDQDPAESAYILRALGGTGDVDHVGDILARQLLKDTTRRSAAEALLALGPGVEPIIIPLIEHRDPGVGREACNILAQVGTAKALASLKAVPARNQGLKNAAQEAIKAIEARISNGS